MDNNERGEHAYPRPDLAGYIQLDTDTVAVHSTACSYGRADDSGNQGFNDFVCTRS